MNIFYSLYTEVLFRPLFNVLVGITQFIPGHNIGVAIVIMTIIVRLLLLPSSLHQAKQAQKQQGKMEGLKKDLEKIKQEHKHDKTKQAEATMALYRKAGINPAAGCLPLLIQLPILIAIYRVFFTGLGPDSYQYLYSFVPAVSQVQTTFLGMDTGTPNLVLAIITGIAQFVQMKFLQPAPTAQPGADENTAKMMASMQKNMALMFPVMTVFIAMRLPSALALYWLVSTLFGIAQQYTLKKALHLKSAPPGM